MKRTIVCLLCFLICQSTFCGQAAAHNREKGQYNPVQTDSGAVAVFIDGESFSPLAPLHIKDGVTFVPVRAFCEAMDANAAVSWNNINNTVSVTSQGLDMEIVPGQEYLSANGRYLYIRDGSFLLQNHLMAPVRQLAKAFGATVKWDEKNKAVYIFRENCPIMFGESFYQKDDIYWLSRIIYAESGAETLEGQIGVGNVVLNRVANVNYPDTIYEVVFDTLYGVQFTPISNGAINNEPSQQSIIAAKLVLDGANTVGDSLFFLNEAIATDKWIVYNCDFVVTIGGHSFYT